MFDKYRFQKKYSILVEFVKDKEIMSDFLSNDKIFEFYNANITYIQKLIDYLKKLYPEDIVRKIILEIIRRRDEYNLHKYTEEIGKCIDYSLKHHGDIEPIKNIDIDNLVNYSSESRILDLCFEYDYKEDYNIKGIKIIDLFKNSKDIELKIKLYTLLKNGNLDLFVSMYNNISISSENIKDISLLLKEEIDDIIYSKETINALGEDYKKMIDYFFNKGNNDDRIIITSIIRNKNYSLLKEILLLMGNNNDNIREYLDINDTTKKIEDIPNIVHNKLFRTTRSNISIVELVNVEYIGYLYMVMDYEDARQYYIKHQQIIELSEKIISYNSLSNEDKLNLYRYSQQLTQEDKDKINEEIATVNREVVEFYKNKFSTDINDGEKIINKAVETIVNDSKNNKHNVKVYELKDEEPFLFLITAMLRGVRETSVNDYGRPSHTKTIDDPSQFLVEQPNGSKIISTSLIDDYNIGTFVGDFANIMYIFCDIHSDDILSICKDDGHYSPEGKDDDEKLFRRSFLRGETIPCGPRQLVADTRDYNEIAINRNRNNEKIKPTAILCFDVINDDSIKHAEYFNIPIIVINTRTYRHLKGFYRTEEERNVQRGFFSK